MNAWKKGWVFGLFLLVTLGMACSPAITDGVPTTINPSTLRISVNETATLTVFLSKPREAEGALTLTYDDPAIAQNSDGAKEIKIQPGDSSISFEVQGLKEGDTKIYAAVGDSRATAAIRVTAR